MGLLKLLLGNLGLLELVLQVSDLYCQAVCIQRCFFQLLAGFEKLLARFSLARFRLNLGFNELLLGRHELRVFRAKIAFVELAHIFVPVAALVHLDQVLVLFAVLLLKFVDFLSHALFFL